MPLFWWLDQIIGSIPTFWQSYWCSNFSQFLENKENCIWNPKLQYMPKKYNCLLPVNDYRIGRCLITVSAALLVTTSTTHDFMGQKDATHFRILVLAFVYYRLKTLYWTGQLLKTLISLEENLYFKYCYLKYHFLIDTKRTQPKSHKIHNPSKSQP